MVVLENTDLAPKMESAELRENRELNSIDHFHKWRPIINSFANIKISLTNLILKLIIQKSFYSETRLVRLI